MHCPYSQVGFIVSAYCRATDSRAGEWRKGEACAGMCRVPNAIPRGREDQLEPLVRHCVAMAVAWHRVDNGWLGGAACAAGRPRC